ENVADSLSEGSCVHTRRNQAKPRDPARRRWRSSVQSRPPQTRGGRTPHPPVVTDSRLSPRPEVEGARGKEIRLWPRDAAGHSGRSEALVLLSEDQAGRQ